MIRTLTFSIAFTIAASQGAIAAPQTESPMAFALSEANISQTAQNYVNAGQRLSRDELIALDAKLVKAYGNPTSVRGSLKTWEIANSNAAIGQSEITTIMCGIDRDGSHVFVIDGRGPAQGDNPRLFEAKENSIQSLPKTSISPSFNQNTMPGRKLNDWE
jgi:hypothetical protein